MKKLCIIGFCFLLMGCSDAGLADAEVSIEKLYWGYTAIMERVAIADAEVQQAVQPEALRCSEAMFGLASYAILYRKTGSVIMTRVEAARLETMVHRAHTAFRRLHNKAKELGVDLSDTEESTDDESIMKNSRSKM